MQIYAIKFHFFMRFGSHNNSVVFDLFDEEIKLLKENKLSIDKIYNDFKNDPISRIAAIKKRGINKLIGICGIINNNLDSSNGSGKSTILEGISYALYDMIIRKNVGTDKTGEAGLSVVTRVDNGQYPPEMRESYVEMIFEVKDKVYFIKRGRTFSKNQNNSTPILEFRCLNEQESYSGHRKKDTQSLINDVININYDIFCNSIMFGQNDAGKFVMGTDKVKKEMIVSLLNLEHIIDGYLDNVRNRKNFQEKNIIALKSQLNLLKSYLEEKPSINDIEIKLKELQQRSTSISENIKNVDEQIKNLEKSSELVKLQNIIDEGKKKKLEQEQKEKEKNEQLNEWQNILEQTSKNIINLKNKIQNVDFQINNIKLKIAEKNDFIKKTSYEDLKNKILALEELKTKKVNINAQIIELEKQNETLVSKISNFTTLYNINNNNILLLKKQLNKMGDKKNFECPECKSVVSKEHVLNKIQEYQIKNKNIESNLVSLQKVKEDLAKQTSSLKKKNNEMEEQINICINAENQIKQYEIEKNRLKELQEDFNEFNRTKEQLKIDLSLENQKNEELQKKKNEIEEKYSVIIQSIKNKILELTKQYKEILNIANDIKIKIENLNNFKIQLNKDKTEIDALIGSYQKEISLIKDTQIKSFKIQNDVEKAEKQFKYLNILEDIYGLEGIQSRIVAKYLPLLLLYINEFITLLTDGAMEIELFLNDKSRIDMTIKGGTSNVYYMLSGGEKVLVKLAVSIGLGLLSFARSTAKPEIIMLDEIFGSLDNTHINAVFKMLDVLNKKFSRILLISHHPQINEAIEHKVIVEKDEGNWGLSKIKFIQ